MCSTFVQLLILNPHYDINVTIPLLEGTRFNRPFRDMLLTDVIRPAYLQNFLPRKRPPSPPWATQLFVSWGHTLDRDAANLAKQASTLA